jgi:glycosyltransferase involved in cell wall biosynthesis
MAATSNTTYSEKVEKGATFFSIVMPCYQVQDCIERALECVQAQTFANWELIVVDDCSPDLSGEIAEEFARYDQRIKVIHHGENKGLAVARNTGILQARGRYVWMPDADDTYNNDLLESVYAVLSKAGNIDLVMFGHTEEYYNENGTFLYTHPLPLQPGSYDSPEAWHAQIIDFERTTHYGYAWNKIYKLSRIQALNLSFEQVKLIEDICFNIRYFQDAQSLATLAGTPYHYTKRQGKSLTNANDYSSSEYLALHQQRTWLLYKQLESWNVLDSAARATLGALYGRYALSALERQCNKQENLTRKERRACCKKLYEDALFEELIKCARVQSVTLKVCLFVLKTRNITASLALARIVHFAHTHAYQLFTRARSER